MSTAKPGIGKLVAEARVVVQLPGDIQEFLCFRWGRLLSFWGWTCQMTHEMCGGCQQLIWAENCYPLLMHMSTHSGI